MNPTENSVAFGAPGIEPRWTSSAKEDLGTAYLTSCRVWFTFSHGIVSEIYYPTVDQPNTRDLQYLISDRETFCHEEKRGLDHRIEYPERDCLFYRLTNSEPDGRYRLIKHILADPHRSVGRHDPVGCGCGRVAIGGIDGVPLSAQRMTDYE